MHRDIDAACAIIDGAPSWKALDQSNELGQTPLHLAVLTDQPIICRKLVTCGASLLKRDRHGNTPLHLASKHGFFNCAIALTRHITHNEVQFKSYCIPFQCIPQAQEIQNYEGTYL